MKPAPIKVNSLATVDLGKFSNSSNTYRVVSKLRGKKVLLAHPLTEECFIIKDEESLNKVAPSLKSPTEKCLDFCKKHKNLLGFKSNATLDALCYYFVIRKDLAANQKEELAILCAKIANITLKNNLLNALTLITDNLGVLDEFNLNWYTRLQPSLKNIASLEQKQVKQVVKIAGFILAQIEESHV